MLKILMLTANSSLMDGINRHILTVASAVAQISEFDVAVCTVMPAGDLNFALERNGVKTFSLNACHGHDLSTIGSFYKIVKQYQPDIVHSHVMALMERIVLSTFFRHKKYVATIHGICDKVEGKTMRMRIESLLTKIFSIPFSAKCYISNGVKDALSINEIEDYKVEVIYNPISFPDISLKKYALHDIIGVSKETPIIGTSCRVAYVKNPMAFTAVMCKVLEKMPLTHAVVMGDGDKELIRKCQDIVSRYEVENRFHWLGYRKDAPELVRDLSCFVMTSISEGLPTSLLECMASKTPIAFWKGNGGLKDIAEFNEKEGPMAVVAEKGDIDGLVTGIVALVGDSSRQIKYAERAYEIGKIHFNVDVIVKKLSSLYLTL